MTDTHKGDDAALIELKPLAELLCRQHYGDRGLARPGIDKIVAEDWPAWIHKAEEVKALLATDDASLVKSDALVDELEGVVSDLQSSGWARAPQCVTTLKRVMTALAARGAGQGEAVAWRVFGAGASFLMHVEPKNGVPPGLEVEPLFASPPAGGDISALNAIIDELMESFDWVGTGSGASGDADRKDFEERIERARAASIPVGGSGGWRPDREAVAREVNPNAWKLHDEIQRVAQRPDQPRDFATMKSHCAAQIAVSVERATRILALAPAPSQGESVARLVKATVAVLKLYEEDEGSASLPQVIEAVSALQPFASPTGEA